MPDPWHRHQQTCMICVRVTFCCRADM
jgi:hypothetical protein